MSIFCCINEGIVERFVTWNPGNIEFFSINVEMIYNVLNSENNALLIVTFAVIVYSFDLIDLLIANRVICVYFIPEK